jgi:glycosyltransferase involved in cell wall biosynthesis
VSALRPLLRPVRRAWIAGRASSWPPYSRLFLVEHSPGWALADVARELGEVAGTLGVELGEPRWAGHVRRQAIFHLSHFSLLRSDFPRTDNRLATAYYHGRPGTPGYPEFDEAYGRLRSRHSELARIQVSHREMLELVLESGIDSSKVFLIPIGVNARRFVPSGAGERAEARRAYAIPGSAFVVGSLQKDGVGWGEGLEPKPVKGPDVLLTALGRLRTLVPDLFVVLTGPARGYVKAGLERLGIPYRHVVVDFREIPRVYHALDACLIASRQEGGPQALLEAMASGVPVVTTGVGQAPDLVRSGENGWIVEVEDAEGLAQSLAGVHGGSASPELLGRGRRTAEENSYEAQQRLWREFFEGFVAGGGT